MRYQVPQFVDVEDQIIGPLTLKQFLIYVVAALLLVPVYLYSDLSLFLTIALPVVGIAVAFAHWKINGRTLAATTGSGLAFYSSSQLYLWRRTDKLFVLTLRDRTWDELILGRENAREERSTLAAIARELETEGHISKVDESDPLQATT